MAGIDWDRVNKSVEFFGKRMIKESDRQLDRMLKILNSVDEGKVTCLKYVSQEDDKK